MAKAAAGLNGEGAAKIWLEHAASAPRDPRPGADGEFHLTREGWARMIRDYMEFARLSPPPIEEAVIGMAPEEVRLLLAPPVMEEEPFDDLEADAAGAAPEDQRKDEPRKSPAADDDNRIHDEEEGERAANAAREVS
jgi:HemY protein